MAGSKLNIWNIRQTDRVIQTFLVAVSVTLKRTLWHERLNFQPKNNDISSPVDAHLFSNYPDLSTMVFKHLMSVFEVDSH